MSLRRGACCDGGQARRPIRAAPVLSRVALLLAVVLAGFPVATSAQGVAVFGTDRALVLPPSGAVISGYRNAGYEMRFRSGGVEIVSRAVAGESLTAFKVDAEAAADDVVSRLARRLTAGARTRHQAVSLVLGWLSGNILYSLDRELPQDPDAVLERRSGYCTGVARLAVAMLHAVAIPAREVPGYVLADGAVAAGSGEGYHRWIEVFDPEVGWVFSDPLATHHWVPATYLRLGSEEVVGPGARDDGALLWHSHDIHGSSSVPGVARGVQVGRPEVSVVSPITASNRHRRGSPGEPASIWTVHQEWELSK